MVCSSDWRSRLFSQRVCGRNVRARCFLCVRQLILPEALKTLPLLLSAALKMDAFCVNTKPMVVRYVFQRSGCVLPQGVHGRLC